MQKGGVFLAPPFLFVFYIGYANPANAGITRDSDCAHGIFRQLKDKYSSPEAR